MIVKLPDGSSMKFFFNLKTKKFEETSCSDCEPTQMDSDLTPLHTEWCPHTRNTVVFAYNHVLKMDLKYRFDCESGRFQEIECHECHLNPEKVSDPKQIVLVATSPKSKRAVVLTMNKEGRVQKMQFDETAKKYVDMEPTAVKALTERTSIQDLEEKETECEVPRIISNLTLEEVTQSESDLIPLYREKSKILPNTDILIGKNVKNGKLGMYVFDRYLHQFLQVELPDVKYKQSKSSSLSELQKLIFLTMSTKDQQAISIQQSPDGGIKKYHYNRETALFDLMEEMQVIDSEEEVDTCISKILKEGEIRTRKCHSVLEFLKTVKPYMVTKNTSKNLAYDPDEFLYASYTEPEESSPTDTSSSTDTDEDEGEEPLSSDTDSSDDSLSDDSFEMVSKDEIN